jgi:hypothetical protein
MEVFRRIARGNFSGACFSSLELFGQGPQSVLHPAASSGTNGVIKLFLGRLPIFGCAMFFSSNLKALILPFPKWVEAHEHWIYLIALTAEKTVTFEPSITVHRRVHSRNVTPRTSRRLSRILKSRAILIWNLFNALYRALQPERIN